MTLFWLTVITASRLVVCTPFWIWCWWKQPRGMALWLTLDGAWFYVTDQLDGRWARQYGLVTNLGYCLDHLADLLFYGTVLVTLYYWQPHDEAPIRHRRRAPEAQD